MATIPEKEKSEFNQAPVIQQIQPGQIPPMTLLPGNRNVKNLPLDANGKRDWSFGLLSCCADMSACCCACWCPCLLHAKNKRRLTHLNEHGQPDPRRDETVVADSLVYAVIEVAFDMGWILQIGTRQSIRERYNIKGSGFGDCCAAFCCSACDLVQGHRELKLEEDSFQQQTQ